MSPSSPTSSWRARRWKKNSPARHNTAALTRRAQIRGGNKEKGAAGGGTLPPEGRRGEEEGLFSLLKTTDQLPACVLLPVTQAGILLEGVSPCMIQAARNRQKSAG